VQKVSCVYAGTRFGRAQACMRRSSQDGASAAARATTHGSDAQRLMSEALQKGVAGRAAIADGGLGHHTSVPGSKACRAESLGAA
jgi:hypothetical protein